MLVRKNRPPVSYKKCNQTITIYHNENGVISHRVIEKGAFFDFKKVISTDKTGQTEANSFLLVIPSSVADVQPVYPGDKVFLGYGEPVTTAAEWAAFIPVKVSGLAVVRYVDPKYWNGSVIHWEAGG